MNIELLEAAQAELDHAYVWYERQRAGLGAQFLDEFDAAVRRITAYPHAYQSLGKSSRRCLIKRFPYGVIYGIDKDKIVIIAVANLHRKPDYWENRAE